MGEYIHLQGEYDTRKLGTCESLFYVRFADLRTWVQNGRAEKTMASEEPAAYLDPANGYRFRFPFVGEDDAPWASLDPERGYRLMAPAAVFAESGPHGTTRRVIAYTVGGTEYRDGQPCPNDDGEAVGGEVEIVAQRPMPDGMLWTVVRCPDCGTMWRLTPARAAALAAYTLENDPDPELGETMRRMMEGYRTGAATVWPPTPRAAMTPEAAQDALDNLLEDI